MSTVYYEQKLSLFSNFVLFLIFSLALAPILLMASFPVDRNRVIFILSILLIFWVLLNLLKLKVHLNADTINYHLFPFAQNTIQIIDIRKAEFLKQPIPWWHGLGVRYRPSDKETVYLLKQEKLLRLHLKNGKIISLGVNASLDEKNILSLINHKLI